MTDITPEQFARDQGWTVEPREIDGVTRYVVTHASQASSPHARLTAYVTPEAAWGMAAIRAGWTAFAQERLQASTRRPTRGNPRGYGRPAR